MKKITNTTILKQGEKLYHPIEVGSVIYWIDKETMNNVPVGTMVWNDEDDSFYRTENVNVLGYHSDKIFKVVAQSEPKLEGIPIINSKIVNFDLINENEHFKININKQ